MCSRLVRPPPSSTLFPYTTLFRSLHSDRLARHQDGRLALLRRTVERGHIGAQDRSEEHTSELQSHSEIVCRLLLEKKNARTRRRGTPRWARRRAGRFCCTSAARPP